MKYFSVCSGIEAATVAWHPLRWVPLAFAEIEKFPSAVLAHHYPHVPNLGDMTKFKDWPDAAIDVLVGGTPCQSFSVAGLRQGLADPRGNLCLTFLAIADKYRPEWILWENVPGVLSSDGGRDFGAFLGGLGQLGYGWSYRVLDAQYVRVDGFGRAVPQRRRRVFVVGNLRDWRRAAAVLFERESLCGNTAPRREARERVAGTITASLGRRGGQPNDDNPADYLIAGTLGQRTCDHTSGIKSESDFLVAHSLRAEGFDASEDGTGRGTPLIPVMASGCEGSNGAGIGAIGGPMFALDTHGAHAIAFDTTQITSKTNRCNPQPGEPCHPLAAGAHPPAIAFDARQSDVIQYGDKTGPLDTDGHTTAVQQGWAVRRLTPCECERLQAFPDNYTNIPWHGKNGTPDGPRYKALGNSMAVNAMRWLGTRIQMVSEIAAEIE